jgi:hypothetical protein
MFGGEGWKNSTRLDASAQNQADDDVDANHDGHKAQDEQKNPLPDPDEPVIQTFKRTGHWHEQNVQQGGAIQVADKSVFDPLGERKVGNEDKALQK